MKRIITILAALAFSASAFAQVHITTPTTSLVISADKGKDARYLYYGKRLSDNDLNNLSSSGTSKMNIYPAYGFKCTDEFCLSLTHADGNMSTVLKVEDVQTSQESNSVVTRIVLKDTVYPFYVTVCYRAYQDVDMIETWTEIENKEKKAVMLTRFDSACLPLRVGDTWVSHLNGK